MAAIVDGETFTSESCLSRRPEWTAYSPVNETNDLARFRLRTVPMLVLRRSSTRPLSGRYCTL